MVYKLIIYILLFHWVLMVFSACGTTPDSSTQSAVPDSKNIPLPTPDLEGETSLEETLYRRRSVREYKADPLNISEISQLLWAAQGISDPSGKRTTPSAGALYPLEIYLVAGNVDGLAPGVYRYIPGEHALFRTIDIDLRSELHAAALKQDPVYDAPIVIVITADYERTTGKYGDRGINYVHMEVGFAAQNIYLQAESLNLGTVFIGAFYDDLVKKALQLPDQEQPLGLMPVGKIQ